MIVDCPVIYCVSILVVYFHRFKFGMGYRNQSELQPYKIVKMLTKHYLRDTK